ncbi:unnamed protein product [Gongylonema pulchrum]|uniref:BZIP domain-containing protein n=1 Tax=Gongylonema pulchrum TaxID=637853 RepID=A0A183D4Y2_9BILA|nr:unnamed protein product [Gongylonema pulchrum]
MENRSGDSAAVIMPENEMHSKQASGILYLLLYSRNSTLQRFCASLLQRHPNCTEAAWKSPALSVSSAAYILVLDVSDVTVNTPAKKSELTDTEMRVAVDHDESETSAPPIHVVAKKVRPEEAAQGLRRSTRNRVAPIRRWLGEKPIYRRDEQGTLELVGVEEAVIRDPLLVKYNAVDMSQIIEQQTREQRRRSRARRRRENARRKQATELVEALMVPRLTRWEGKEIRLSAVLKSRIAYWDLSFNDVPPFTGKSKNFFCKQSGLRKPVVDLLRAAPKV